jgi:hypothetical protein
MIGSPGQDEKSERDVEQKGKPSADKSDKPSTMQGGREPLNVGDARQKSTVRIIPIIRGKSAETD